MNTTITTVYLPSPREASSSISFVSATIWFCSWIFFKIVSTLVYYVPAYILGLLSLHISITLSFSSLLGLMCVLVGAVYGIIRYRYLTVYSRLQREPDQGDAAKEVYLASRATNHPEEKHSYLDEFLTAIRIFGYLERPVFHELTKSMSTQKLEPGEKINMNQASGFSILVEGSVKVYCKVGREAALFESIESDHFVAKGNRYQLLNKIKPGNPLSSFISILRLFTEEKSDSSPNHLVGVAAKHSTIAVIPAEAFMRLTEKYPRSTSHIVQMVLARLYRVTFQTAHSYLGLTAEIFKTEMTLNQQAEYDLPTYLYEGVVQRLNSDDIRPELHRQKKTINGTTISNHSRHVVLDSRVRANPGDLLSNVPLSRTSTSAHIDPCNFSAEEETEDSALRLALTESIWKVLGLKHPQEVKKEFASAMVFERVKADKCMIEQNCPTPGLYYVVDGKLRVEFLDRSEKLHTLYSINRGGVAGYLGTLVGHRSLAQVVCEEDSVVAFLPKPFLDRVCDRHALIQLSIAERLLHVLDRQILMIDYALEWVQSEAGHALYHEGEEANGIHIVLNGRFRSAVEDNITEFGLGESLGEVEVLTASKRPATLIAVRDSETARIPRTLFELLAVSNPSIMIKVSRIVAQRLANVPANELNPSLRHPPTHGGSPHSHRSRNYRTITVLPTSGGLPVAEFAEQLVSAFRKVGKRVVSLNQASTLYHLGKHAFDGLAKIKQSGYFADLEERYQTVVYVTDTPVNSQWTRTCIAQGDCILLLADASASATIGDYEHVLLRTKTTAHTELILLHAERAVDPGSTAKWLKHRIWVHSHHHVQLPSIAASHVAGQVVDSSLPQKLIQTSQAKIANLKNRVENIINTDLLKRRRFYESPVSAHKSDFLRLARILSNQAVGLVLGGGGARGIAHIGIIKALEARGIPVDLIGGTSIGSFVGGLYARDYDVVPIYGRAKKFAGRVSSVWRLLFDLTYPVTSYITGHEFNRGIWKAFGDARIEDFWIRFYANSTNITNSCMEIHSSGYAWRYIRASMSLAGLLPPITDNGCMLLDGGYVDNLPAEEMKARGASIIIACDVGSVDDRSPMTYGDSLSGLWVLFNRINPFSSHPNVPSMAEIQMRLAYVASVNALEAAKSTKGVIYLRPPIDNYATLDFAKFDEIYQVGASYGEIHFRQLDEKGEMPTVAGIGSQSQLQGEPRHLLQRRNSV